MARNNESRPSRKCCIITTAVVAVAICVALIIGLSVGLTRGKSNDSGANSSPSSTATPGSNNTHSAGLWRPEGRLTWNYLLKDAISSAPSIQYNVWDIDLFDNSQDTVAMLQSQGSKVICYFSAGSFEDWRPDANNFSQADLGKDLSGWPGEKWVNTNSTSVRDIMARRLDIAFEKNCDGVDPDNMDAYNNENGLGLTQADAINYAQFLADAAQQRNLSMGLKNALEIVPDVIDIMQWSVNEQCAEYNECDTLMPFIRQNKPVFHVEYPKGDTNNFSNVSTATSAEICDTGGQRNFSTIIKNRDLDTWIEPCPLS